MKINTFQYETAAFSRCCAASKNIADFNWHNYCKYRNYLLDLKLVMTFQNLHTTIFILKSGE